MYTKYSFYALLVALTIAFTLTACEKEDILLSPSVEPTDLLEQQDFEAHLVAKAGQEVADLILHPVAKLPGEKVVISATELCDGESVTGTVSGAPFVVEDNTYFSFEAEMGSAVTITVTRIDCELDPIAFVHQGAVADTDDLGFSIASADDNTSIPDGCAEVCFAFSDPTINFVAPSTGSYTVRVGDYASCNEGALNSFTITATGIGNCTIEVADCDTGVEDFDFNGSSAEDQLNACADGARNHGQFVRCVAQLTNAMKAAGFLTEEQKEAIVECAAESNGGGDEEEDDGGGEPSL